MASSSAATAVSISASGSPQTLLKRKRPMRLDIPVATMSFRCPATPSAVARDVVTEESEEYGYSVFCKRGRRETMEDRYSAIVDVHGDKMQVLQNQTVSYTILI